MKVYNLEQTSVGCPTIFEWNNKKGNNIYFRLRHGFARIVNESKNIYIIESPMFGFDGVCNWKDVKRWAKENGLKLKINDR